MGSGSQNHGMLVERWANAKVAGSPAVYSGSGSGTGPSGTVTTVAANSVVSWCCGDYDHDGGQHPPGSKTYRGTPTEEQYWLPGDCVGYFAWQTAASAGAQTIGLSAPTNQSWQMVGIEVQAFNTGALTDGGLSTFDGPANFLAAGGKSVPVNTATGGAGGLASASVCPAGGVKYSGGNGFTASTTGGGAGSSAGDDAAGNNAASQTGASAPTGGIAGGNGGNAGGNNGGSVPGGGAFSTGGNASGANGADGKCQIWYTPPLTAFKTLIVHAPGWDAPDTFSPMIPAGGGLDAPNGTIEYLVPSPVPGLAARFGGTYTIVAVLSNVASPGSSRDITATFTQYDYPGGPSSTAAVTRTLTPSSESPPIVNGVVVLGEVFLPCRDIAPDQTAAYTTVKVNSTQGSDRVLDILALDVTGQVVIINSATGKVNYYLDAPEGVASIGRYLGSDYDRAQASSVLDSVLALSGGPLTIDPGGPGWLLAYSHDPPGAPALNGTFYPRWRDARLT